MKLVWTSRTTLLSDFQVSPIIINTVITIQSALTPTAETPEELDSPVPVDLWERRGWKELKLWFLDEEGDEDTKSLAPLIPQGESLQVSGCSTLYHKLFICFFYSLHRTKAWYIQASFVISLVIHPCRCPSNRSVWLWRLEWDTALSPCFWPSPPSMETLKTGPHSLTYTASSTWR